MPKPENILNPICPICHTRMHKMGYAKWKSQNSKKRKMRFRCHNCGKTLVFPRSYNVLVRKPRKKRIYHRKSQFLP